MSLGSMTFQMFSFIHRSFFQMLTSIFSHLTISLTFATVSDKLSVDLLGFRYHCHQLIPISHMICKKADSHQPLFRSVSSSTSA